MSTVPRCLLARTPSNASHRRTDDARRTGEGAEEEGGRGEEEGRGKLSPLVPRKRGGDRDSLVSRTRIPYLRPQRSAKRCCRAVATARRSVNPCQSAPYHWESLQFVSKSLRPVRDGESKAGV